MEDLYPAFVISALSIVILKVSCLDNKHGIYADLVLLEQSWSEGKCCGWGGIVVVLKVYMSKGLIAVDLLNTDLNALWWPIILEAWGLAPELSS